MISLLKISLLTLLALVALAFTTRAAEPPKRIDVKQYQVSKRVDNVVVPLPNEVFGALNKLGGVNWKEYVRNEKAIISRNGLGLLCSWGR